MSNDICAIEKRIARSVITDLLAAGFTVSVNDGAEETLTNSTDPAAILAAMFTTDEDYLLTRLPTEPFGDSAMVRFVYGNDGWDAINDYSMSLEAVLKPTNDLVDRIDEVGYATILEEEKATLADALQGMVDAQSDGYAPPDNDPRMKAARHALAYGGASDRTLAADHAALKARVNEVLPHIDAWINLLAAYVESLPPDVAPTQQNPDGVSRRSYAQHELRAMRRDLTALYERH